VIREKHWSAAKAHEGAGVRRRRTRHARKDFLIKRMNASCADKVFRVAHDHLEGALHARISFSSKRMTLEKVRFMRRSSFQQSA